MLTNAELKAEWARAANERDEAVRAAGGVFGGSYTLEQRLAIALDDASMALWFVAKLIQRLPDDSATDRESDDAS